MVLLWVGEGGGGNVLRGVDRTKQLMMNQVESKGGLVSVSSTRRLAQQTLSAQKSGDKAA